MKVLNLDNLNLNHSLYRYFVFSIIRGYSLLSCQVFCSPLELIYNVPGTKF